MRVTLNQMLRRAQLALALVLFVVLAPLASATCGIQCLGTPQPLRTHATASPQDCVRASACCHSTGPAVCGATQAPQAIAALLSAKGGTVDAPMFATISEQSLLQTSIRAVHRPGSAPPGPPDGTSRIPLRI